MQSLHILIALFCAVSICIVIYFTVFFHATDDVENFDVPTNTQNTVINIYREIYDRQPNASELMKDSDALDTGKINVNGLRQRMIDSHEYSILIKLQSNSLTPELNKMLSHRDMLTRLGEIYKEECNKVIPKNMVLPIRDIYIYLRYNEFAIRAMLRDPSFPLFEKDVQTTPSMNNPQLLTLIRV
jgi:hypothetical protein